MKTKTKPRPASKQGTPGRAPAVPARAPVTAPPILGVDVKGVLLDVCLDAIIDLTAAPDRLERPGDAERIAQLAGSMREVGQLQPVMLERTADGRFARVFGRRRLAAARMLDWKTIRAVVVPPLSDDVRRTILAVENVQRQDLSPAEETLAVAELLELEAGAAAVQLAKPLLDGCGAWSGEVVTPPMIEALSSGPALEQRAIRHDLLLDHRVRGIACELVAAMLGKPASWVRDRMYIARLSEKARALVLEGKLPLAHAREISKVADAAMRDRLVKDYAAGGSDSIGDAEAGPLEGLQEEVRRVVFALHVVPWNRGVAFAGRPACEGCQHNSATHPGLFEHGGEVSLDMRGGEGTYDTQRAAGQQVQAAGICTLASCYADKLRTAKAAIARAAKRIVDAEPRGVPAKAKTIVQAEVKVPAFVDRRSLTEKVQQQRKLKKSGPRGGKAPAPAKPTLAQKTAEARNNAELEWFEAMRKRAKELEPKIAATLMTTPGLWSIYVIFRKTKTCEATEHHEESKAARAANSPALAALLKCLDPGVDAVKGWKAILTLEKECGQRFGLIDHWRDGPSGMADKIAAALGIEVDPAPTVEDFMPKKLRVAEPDETEEPAKPAGRKRRSRA